MTHTTILIEHGDDEIEVEVSGEADYQPAERQTRNFPGCDEAWTFSTVTAERNGEPWRLTRAQMEQAREALSEAAREDDYSRRESDL